MTLPNKITIARLLSTFVFMFFLFCHGVGCKIAALGVFLLASFSDLLDGYLAKRLNQVSAFGAFMDPLADKVLTLAAFLAFVELKLVPAWMVVLIMSREFLVTGMRFLALSRGQVIAASLGGKQKTVSQFVAIVTVLVFMVFREFGVSVFSFWTAGFEYWYRQLIFLLMLVTVCLTLSSGVSYLVKNRGVFRAQ